MDETERKLFKVRKTMTSVLLDMVRKQDDSSDVYYGIDYRSLNYLYD